ncbi:zf-CCHC domain-containing protein/zf-CCHC_4 domain-containing protein, partial [Cephalotus follicularis]
WCC